MSSKKLTTTKATQQALEAALLPAWYHSDAGRAEVALLGAVDSYWSDNHTPAVNDELMWEIHMVLVRYPEYGAYWQR